MTAKRTLKRDTLKAMIVWEPVERAPRDGRHLIFATFGRRLWEQVWWSAGTEDFINERGYAHLKDNYGRVKATHYAEINVPSAQSQAGGKRKRDRD